MLSLSPLEEKEFKIEGCSEEKGLRQGRVYRKN